MAEDANGTNGPTGYALLERHENPVDVGLVDHAVQSSQELEGARRRAARRLIRAAATLDADLPPGRA